MNKLQLSGRVFWEVGQEFLGTVFGECACVDFVVVAMLVVIVHAVSWWPRWLLWEPLANYRMQGQKTWDVSESHKFSQTATSLLFFCSSAFFVSRILLSKDWLFSREEWHPRREIIEADFKFYHLLYIARFVSDLVSLFFEDRKQDAFIAAFVHHLVTIGLVYASAAVGLTGFGGIVMFIFDWADIPLLTAKLCKYLSKDPKDIFQFVANRLFEAFAVLFLLTRNIIYSYIAYCVVSDLDDSSVSRTVKVMVVILAFLQTYWLYLIVKAVERQKRAGGNVEDVRDKKEE